MQTENQLILAYNLQWFAKDGPGGEKTEPATAKKLSDARDEGKVAKSQELNSAAMLIALFMLLRIFVSFLGEGFVGVFQWSYKLIPEVVQSERSGMTVRGVSTIINQSLVEMLKLMAPFLIGGFVVAIVISIVQVGWKVSTKPMEPKLDKFNPINGFKRIFSKDSVFNLFKSILKIALIFYVAYTCIKDQQKNLFILYEIPLKQAISLIGNIIIDTGLRISLVYLVVGIADYAYQKFRFKEDMKMTKQEVKEEYKNTEGDPQIKGQQRQRMREASQRRMMQDVPKADVVITNPTHISVAIRYDSEQESAPTVLAKGEDYLAMKIREAAKENNVPIMENKPLARAIYATVDIGEQIPPELYQAVAEILAVVYNNRQ
ncbi:MAG: flagellar biosynthesis protein FlhB [Lachnospiraceae bacterium]|nr:flagellar biosynthesis protein FlhB [Lachnospiraceae bacterium]MDD6192522.1 flagellar biosynthesis protein FlhB [Lachnospiraceae bacterium]MDY4794277.1 flagellar biosynthesis protein FlhB [Pararoseburia sp.]